MKVFDELQLAEDEVRFLGGKSKNKYMYAEQ